MSSEVVAERRVVPMSPRRVHARLVAARRLLERLESSLPSAVGVAADQVRGPADAVGEQVGGRRSGWVTDPTGDRATSVVGRETDLFEDLDQKLSTLALTLDMLNRFVEDHGGMPDHPRCTGGRTVDPWSKPECGDLADYEILADGRVSVRGDGLCPSCRKRKQRWEAKQRAERG